LTTKIKPKVALKGNQFNIVHFYDETERGLELLELFERAYEIYESKQLSRAVGWAKVDIVRYPDLAFKNMPNL